MFSRQMNDLNSMMIIKMPSVMTFMGLLSEWPCFFPHGTFNIKMCSDFLWIHTCHLKLGFQMYFINTK